MKRIRSKIKGFTLIEVLAIIVILAIIALITVPVVTNVLKQARKKAFVNSVEIATDVLKEYLNENDYSKFELDGVSVVDLKSHSGNKFVSGKFISNNGVIEASYITDGEFCAKGPIRDLTVVKALDSDVYKCRKLDDTEALVDENRISITATTKSIRVIIGDKYAKDDESGIVEYKVTVVGKETKKSENPGVFDFNGLKHNTEYTVKIEITNGNGIVKTIVQTVKTVEISVPTITIANENEWKPSKLVTFTGKVDGAHLEYKVINGEDTIVDWKEINHGGTYTIDYTSNIEKPTYVYARMTDGENIVDGSTKTQTKVDAEAPQIVSNGTVSKQTSTITIPIRVSDTGGSGIDRVICEYGETSDYGNTNNVVVSNTECKISKLSKNKDYFYRIRVLDNAGNSSKDAATNKEVTGSTSTEDIPVPTITITNENDWKNSKTVTFTGTAPGAHLEYKVVNGSTTKVEWTEVSSGGTYTINYPSNNSTPTTIYLKLTDGTNTVDATSKVQTKVDTTAPNVSLTTSDLKTSVVKLTATCVDNESTITKYEFSKDNGSTWINNGKTNTYTFDKLTHNKTYNFKVRCTNGAGTPVTASADGKTAAMCTPAIAITNENDWKNSKIVTFTGSAAGASLQYKVVNGSTTKQDWITVASGSTYTIDYTSNVTTPTYIYSRCTDGTNTIDATTKTQTKVDVTAPSCPTSYGGVSTTWATSRNITAACGEEADNDNSGCTATSFKQSYTTTTKTATPSITIKDNAGNTRSCSPSSALNIYVDKTAPTNTKPDCTSSTGRVTVTIKQTDANVGTLSNIKYGYSTSESGTYTWGTSSAITGLTKGTNYYVKTQATDSLGNGPTTSAATLCSTKGQDVPTITYKSGSTSSWAQSKTVVFNIGTLQAQNKLQYRIKNGSTWKVGGDSTWVDTTKGAEVTIDYESTATTPTYIYLRVVDTDNSSNVASSTTFTEATIDRTAPSCPTSYGGASTTWATSRNITAACGEEADNDNSGCTATSFKQSYTTTTKTATPSITIKDNAGNTRSCSPSSALNIYVDKTAPNDTAPDCTSSTGRVTVTIKQTDANVGTLSNIKYGYSTSENGTYTWETSSAITGLTKGTKYYVKTQAKDSLGNGATTSKATLCTTKGQNTPTITYKSGSTADWAKSKVVVLNIGTLEAQNKLQYRVKNGSSWKKADGSATSSDAWIDTTKGAEVTINYESTASTPTTVYLRVIDTDNNNNVAEATTFTEATVDRTAPTCGSWSGASTTYATSRNLSVACSETADTNHSGCSATSFKKSYTTTTVTATPSVEISDKAGNKRTCTASSAMNVYVDKTAPNDTAPDCTSSTGRVTITIKQTDANVGTLSNIKYGYSTSENGTYTWGTSSAITGLTKGTNYYVKTQAKDSLGNGATTSKATLCTTKGQNTPTITYKSGSSSDWAKSKVVVLNIGTLEAQNKLQYRIKNGSTWKVGGDSTWVDTTKGAEVTIDYESTATTPTYIYLRVIDTDNNNNVANATTFTETKVEKTSPTVKTVYAGKMLYTDPTFSSGSNSVKVYNNSKNGTVTHERKSGTTPEGSYYIHIKTNGAASPGTGGFYFANQTAANKVYISRIVAKIPTGYTIEWASNATGDGRTNEWLTSRAGTGNWEEYVNVTTCGATGTFSSTSFFYLSGTAGTSSAPVEWDVAYATVFDTTAWAQTNYVVSAAQDSLSGLAYYGLNQNSSTGTFNSITNKTNVGKVSSVTANGTYYAWYKDKAGNQNKGSVSVSYVDRTAPTLALNGTPTMNAGKMVVNVNATDTQVKDIGTVSCKAGTSASSLTINGTPTKGTRSGNVTPVTCTFTGLTKGTKYYYSVTAADSLGNTSSALTGDGTTGGCAVPTIAIANETAWKNSKVVTFTAGTCSGGKLQYRIKNGSTWKTSSGTDVWVDISSGGTYTINYTSNATTPTYIYARMYDPNNSGNTAEATTKTQTKVDVTAPSCPSSYGGASTTWATSRSLTAACSEGADNDNSGCVQTSYSKSYTTTTVTATPSFTLADNAGNTRSCSPSSAMNVYVDKTAPNTTAPTVSSTTSTCVVTMKQTDANVATLGDRYYAIKTGSTWGSFVKDNNNTHTFTGLTKNTQYYVKTKACDSLGNCSGETTEVGCKTGNITAPTITIANENDWKSSKVVTFTGTIPSGAKMQYKVVNGTTTKVDWKDVANNGTYTINYASNTTTPTYVYLRITDGTNTVDGTSKTQTKVDVTNANTTKPTATSDFTSVTVTNKQADGESGIGSVEYGIATSATGTYTWQTSNKFTGKSYNTKYFVKTRVRNGAGLPSSTTWTESAYTEISTPNPVASNTVSSTTTYYSSLQAAIDASTGGTSTLMRDSTEDVTVASGTNKTVNLNGKTLTGKFTNRGTVTVNGNGSIYGLMRNYGTYTMTNGTIYYGTEGWLAYNEGTFNMNGGFISNSLTTDAVALYNVGTATLKNGEFNSAGYGVVNHGGTMTANSIKVTAGVTGIWSRSSNTSGSTKIYNSDIKVSGTDKQNIGIVSSSIRTDVWDTNVVTSGGYILVTDKYNTNTKDGSLYFYAMKTDGSACAHCTLSGGTIPNLRTFTIAYSSSGYTVRSFGHTNTEKVEFPTWTSKQVNGNAQDDIVWHVGTYSTSGLGKFSQYVIKKSEHNNETGEYQTHFYYTPSGGSRTALGSMTWTYK